jgi:hypothetical protein
MEHAASPDDRAAIHLLRAPSVQKRHRYIYDTDIEVLLHTITRQLGRTVQTHQGQTPFMQTALVLKEESLNHTPSHSR